MIVSRAAHYSPPQLSQQVVRVDWFGQDVERMALGAGSFQKIGSCGLSGEQENLARRMQLANLDCGFDPVHVRHDDVADDQVGPAHTGTLYRFGSGVNG